MGEMPGPRMAYIDRCDTHAVPQEAGANARMRHLRLGQRQASITLVIHAARAVVDRSVMMRSLLASVLVTVTLLGGCKSTPQSSDGLFGFLEHEGGAAESSMASVVNMDDYKHLAAGVILVLLVIGVWSAMAARETATDDDVA